MKLGFFILNFRGALAIRLQDPFVQVEGLPLSVRNKIGVSCERQMNRPAAKNKAGTGS
jgi:hypothetical protein